MESSDSPRAVVKEKKINISRNKLRNNEEKIRRFNIQQAGVPKAENKVERHIKLYDNLLVQKNQI